MDDMREQDLKIHIWEDQARIEKAKAEVYERDAERSAQFHYALQLMKASAQGGHRMAAHEAWQAIEDLLDMDGAGGDDANL